MDCHLQPLFLSVFINGLNFLLVCSLGYTIKSVITVRTPGKGMFVDRSSIMQDSQ